VYYNEACRTRKSQKTPHLVGHSRKMVDPSISILSNHILNRTFISHTHVLLLNRSTSIIEALGLIHSALQRIPLPPKHVISMRAITSSALETPDEWIALAFSPETAEFGRVPDCFVDDLWDADGVRGWAGSGVLESECGYGVVHVGLVVGAVEVYAVPAGGEVVGYKDTGFALLCREVLHLRASVN